MSSMVFIEDLTVFATSESIPSTKYSFGTPIFKPFTSPSKYSAYAGTSSVFDVLSFGSFPEIASNTKAESCTFLVNGPI